MGRSAAVANVIQGYILGILIVLRILSRMMMVMVMNRVKEYRDGVDSTFASIFVVKYWLN